MAHTSARSLPLNFAQCSLPACMLSTLCALHVENCISKLPLLLPTPGRLFRRQRFACFHMCFVLPFPPQVYIWGTRKSGVPPAGGTAGGAAGGGAAGGSSFTKEADNPLAKVRWLTYWNTFCLLDHVGSRVAGRQLCSWRTAGLPRCGGWHGMAWRLIACHATAIAWHGLVHMAWLAPASMGMAWLTCPCARHGWRFMAWRCTHADELCWA